tara:strand:+ start:1826 stop:1966 length:141 start_codon:yes stop_codon:yes gene_type:complete
LIAEVEDTKIPTGWFLPAELIDAFVIKEILFANDKLVALSIKFFLL